MNLHLLWDEKIVKRIIKTFDTVFPDNNIYVIWKVSPYINKDIADRNDVLYIQDHNDTRLAKFDFSNIDKVIVHALENYKIDFIVSYVKKTVPIYWLLWGGEIYNGLLYHKGFPVYYKYSQKRSIRSRIGHILQRLGYITSYNRKFLKFIKQNDVSMLCCKEEYDIFCKYFPSYTKNLLNIDSFFYYPIDEILNSDLLDKTAQGNVIMVGNSGSFTNNHEYVFKYLQKIDLRDKTIIAPLNYNGTPEYRNQIHRKGLELFGNRFYGLTEFLSLDDYNKLLLKAEVALFGNWRQEAVGNIVIELYLGSKVFLSRKSPLLSHFRSLGITLFELEKINEKELHIPLPEDLKRRNRDILISLLNWDRLQKVTKDIFG